MWFLSDPTLVLTSSSEEKPTCTKGMPLAAANVAHKALISTKLIRLLSDICLSFYTKCFLSSEQHGCLETFHLAQSAAVTLVLQ